MKKNNVLTINSKNLNSENWIVYHPNGKKMFVCGNKRAEWYLKKKLATIIGDYEIKLTFIPKGLGFNDDEIFGLCARKNICVVSGRDYDLQRHHIVPYCYRTYLPVEYKSKNHHDVVLINREIHSQYEKFANDFKKEIAKLYNIKTVDELNSEYISELHKINSEYSKIKSAILVLLKNHTLTINNKRELLRTISQLTNIQYDLILTFNYLQLYKLLEYVKIKQIDIIDKFKKNNKKYYDHGYWVVQKLDTEEKIKEFIMLWRKHFINTMKPKYLPNGWSVNFRIKSNKN